jgi:hypothetical protein
LRIYGLVRNIISKKITPYEQLEKDKRILGVFGLSWAVFRSVLPKEITDACDKAIDMSGMPTMTYDQDDAGRYTIIT